MTTAEKLMRREEIFISDDKTVRIVRGYNSSLGGWMYTLEAHRPTEGIWDWYGDTVKASHIQEWVEELGLVPCFDGASSFVKEGASHPAFKEIIAEHLAKPVAEEVIDVVDKQE